MQQVPGAHCAAMQSHLAPQGALPEKTRKREIMNPRLLITHWLREKQEKNWYSEQRLRISVSVSILAFLSFSFASSPPAPGYLWPMARPPVLTSSFGEVRSGHIHSGIDLSTGGRTGEPVRAVANGRVIRLSVSPWGYGRAVYLQLEDGRVAVYAHLERLAAPLARIVYAEQKRAGRFRINLVLDENPVYAGKPIRVRRGEIIAYSGESGAGHPHLHFEIRDRIFQYPLNPLRSGFPVQDRVSPKINGMLIRPTDLLSTVNADQRIVTWKIAPGATGDGVMIDTPWVFGSAGLAVAGSDQADPGYSLAGYARSLWIDDSLVFRASYDTLPYEISRQILLDRDNAGNPWNKVSFEKLYHETGCNLPIYGCYGEGQGLINLARRKPGLYKIRVGMEDVSGNRTSVTGVLGLGRPPFLDLFKPFRDSAGYGLTVRMVRGSFVFQRFHVESSQDGKTWATLIEQHPRVLDSAIHIRIPQIAKGIGYVRGTLRDSLGQWSQPIYSPLSAPSKELPISEPDLSWFGEAIRVSVPVSPQSQKEPRVLVRFADSAAPIPVPLRRTALNAWTGQVSLADKELHNGKVVAFWPGDTIQSARSIRPYRIQPKSGGYLTTSDTLASVEIPGACVIQPLIAELVESKGLADGPTPGLVARSKAYTMAPAWFYTDQRFEMELALLDTTKAEFTNIYQWTGRDWSFVEGKFDPRLRRLKAKASSLRPFAAFMDTLAPEIKDLSIEPNQNLFSSPHEIHFHIAEKGSGINSDLQIKTWIDGQVWINEYDPERSRVRIERTRELLPGLHTLRILLSDAAGNTVNRTIPFHIGRN